MVKDDWPPHLTDQIHQKFLSSDLVLDMVKDDRYPHLTDQDLT